MSAKSISDIKPFISVMIIIAAFFSVAFAKMEVRRMGYLLLKQTRLEKNLADEKRQKSLMIASLTRPDRIESLAQTHLALNKALRGQIVQITGRIALRGE